MTDGPFFYRVRAWFFYVAGPVLVGLWFADVIGEDVLIAITLLVSFFTQGATDTTTYRVEQTKDRRTDDQRT